MRKELNALGMVCPRPVIEAKKILESSQPGDVIRILVDNEIAVENLEKLALQLGQGFATSQEKENVYEVLLEVKTLAQTLDSGEGGAVVVIASDKMGEDEMLGKLLLKGFIYALTESSTLPEKIIFYNRGALVNTKESPSLQDLEKLASRGVDIMTCGTCLNYFGLEGKLGVGRITNMYDIVEAQMQGRKIIKP